ncbi:HNH endonuclease [Aeromicrobium sp.]|uniref:HNH endonuclease n=1 Tax=Aeromicrobium sp. TaxID=1871063 RepID=UPI0040347B2A
MWFWDHEGEAEEKDTPRTAANDERKHPKTPTGTTWDHVEGGRTLQLVPRDMHRAVRHTSGVAVLQ